MSDDETGGEQGGYGHPEADWTDAEERGGGEARRSHGRGKNGEGESGNEPPDEEDEPPDAADLPSSGEPLSAIWAQPQGRYPAQERPPDSTDAHEAPPSDPAAPAASADAAERRRDEPPPAERPHAPDATTGDEGGGTDAEFRDEGDREAGKPPRKSPGRERRRAG